MEEENIYSMLVPIRAISSADTKGNSSSYHDYVVTHIEKFINGMNTIQYDKHENHIRYPNWRLAGFS
jgi:hypothetical protein